MSSEPTSEIFYAESLLFQSPDPSDLPLPMFQSPDPSDLPLPIFDPSGKLVAHPNK